MTNVAPVQRASPQSVLEAVQFRHGEHLQTNLRQSRWLAGQEWLQNSLPVAFSSPSWYCNWSPNFKALACVMGHKIWVILNSFVQFLVRVCNCLRDVAIKAEKGSHPSIESLVPNDSSHNAN